MTAAAENMQRYCLPYQNGLEQICRTAWAVDDIIEYVLSYSSCWIQQTSRTPAVPRNRVYKFHHGVK